MKKLNFYLYRYRNTLLSILYLFLICFVITKYSELFKNTPFLYIFPVLAVLALALALYKDFFMKKSEFALKMDEFWNKYDLNNKSNEYIDNKISEIANLNSDFPESDKRLAKQLKDFKNSLNA